MKKRLTINFYLFLSVSFLVALINLKYPAPSFLETGTNVIRDFLICQAIYWGLYFYSERVLNKALIQKPKSKLEKDWLKSIDGTVKFGFTTLGTFALLIGIGFTIAGVSQLTKPENNYKSLFIVIGVPLCFIGPRILEHLNELKNSAQLKK